MKTKRLNFLWFTLVMFIPLGLYLTTFSETNVAFGDSDLMTLLGYYGGVAQPPGYPLSIVLTFLFTHLPLSLTIAGRANLLSVFLSSFTLGIIFLSVRLFQSVLPQVKTNQGPVIALLAVVSLMLLAPFWLFSLVAEKYALNLFLASGLIYLCLLLFNSSGNRFRIFLCLCFLLGLTLPTHLTLWFLLPMVVYTLYLNKPPAKAILGLIIGIIIPLGILILLNLNVTSPLSWHFPATAPGLLNHLTMRAYFQHNPELRPLTQSFLIANVNYLKFLINSYGWLESLLALFGLVMLVRHQKDQAKPIKLIFLGTAFTLLTLPLIVRWPALYSGQAIVQRQYLTGYLFLPFLFSAGLTYLLNRRSSAGKTALLTLTALVLIGRLIYLYPHLNLKTDRFISNFYHELLSNLPPQTNLFCFSDVSCFALLYDQLINSNRHDVSINIEADSFLPNPSPPLTSSYLNQHLPDQPVRFIDLNQKYFDLLKLETGAFYLAPSALSTVVTLEPSVSSAAVTRSYSDFLLTANFLPIDPVRRQRLAGAMQRHLVHSMAASIRQDQPTFLQESGYAKALAAKLGELYTSGVSTVLNLYQNHLYPTARP